MSSMIRTAGLRGFFLAHVSMLDAAARDLRCPGACSITSVLR
ncbi:MAG: hypothetical protein ABIP45_12120 [Knoellia sp.]